jgi:hypothetical protein
LSVELLNLFTHYFIIYHDGRTHTSSENWLFRWGRRREVGGEEEEEEGDEREKEEEEEFGATRQ